MMAGAQTTQILTPSEDNTLYESAAGNISNGKGTHIFAGKTKNGAIRRGLLKFDISGTLPPGAIITEISLSLTMDQTIAGPELLSLHALNRNWGEGASKADGEGGTGTTALAGDATWLHTLFPANPWSSPGGDFISQASSTTLVGGDGSYAWTSPQMVKEVQRWLDTPAVNFGWCLIGNESQSTTAKRFASRESPSPDQRPKLTITYRTLSTSIGNDPGPSGIQFFPNPSTGKFYFRNKGWSPVSIAIFNSLGLRVYERTPAMDQNELDLSNQTQGIYWYRIVDGSKKVETGKLVINY